ncbi:MULTISPECIES: hypothetical protein [unclassified Lactococcus]|uniref:hypothetical protein n=1 Tax=unclassified Lactococcus TaxID=2643510 RepID=UPI0011C8CE96|nr:MULTISPECIES: hypothetical protein [unclassified Lactococcus]TXK37773.1 hypothetical protein FVP42_08065 [Lactococcus sp. dk310]
MEILKQMEDSKMMSGNSGHTEMMSRFSQEGHLGLHLIGGGFVMGLVVLAVIAAIYFYHKNNGQFFIKSFEKSGVHGPSQMSDEELESRLAELNAEYKRRHQAEKLEKELLLVKEELANLRAEKAEEVK